MKKLKITVLSGGSGNDAILKGIKYYYPECDLKVITNAYDNGKSTGVCRYVTDTLGVSDIRKNHTRLYKIMTPKSKQNKEILDFYDKRYDFTKGKEKQEILDILNSYGFVCAGIRGAVEDFFKIKKSKNLKYKDFSIANIVYSAMYKRFGYEKTNDFFCKLLGIDDDSVLLNSFDNVYLKAKTESGYIIEDEGELVEWSNKKDKIVDIFFEGKYKGLNQRAIDRIMDSDLIIHSTGTFWSSIYPTMKYGDFYKYVNMSKAKKIWIMNTAEDKDAFGVNCFDFLCHYANLGLYVNDWEIIQNIDAVSSLNELPYAHSYKLGNNKGKNDPKKVGKAIFKVYYGLEEKFDKILLDFDDTIVGRQGEYKRASENNLSIIQKNPNLTIISCNFYKALKKSCSLYNYYLDKFENVIWADVNTNKYIKGKKVCSIKENKLKDFRKIKKLIPKSLLDKTDFSCKYCIKIKPVDCRHTISVFLNKKFKLNGICAIAEPTGRTTVDILSPCNKKGIVWYKERMGKYKTLYIGDEISKGNDSTIAYCCDKAIEVNNPVETNIILKLLRK